MLNIKNAMLIVIDFQEKLVKITDENENCIKNCVNLVSACKILDIPTIITEQYPKGLGKTISKIEEINDKVNFFEKNTFSAYSTNEIKNFINESNKKDIIICGIETHICALQTALELLENNFNVYFVKDACLSRNIKNYNNAINRLLQTPIVVTDTEMTLFELLKSSSHKHFKEIQQLIK